jgi:SAM-dependent methyltransferase
MSICPICSDVTTKRFHCSVNLVWSTEYDLVECLACGVLYFHPMPTESELTRFYSAAYYTFDRSREEAKGRWFAARLRRWKSMGTFLDVGCATGFFLHGIKTHSAWEVYGTEFGESAVQFARERLGLNVTQGNLVDAHFPEAFFDYVHVNNVLEHVLDPMAFLKEVKRIVKPDGMFFLSVPNGFNDSRDLIKFYKLEHTPARSKNGHLFFFPAPTLLLLFERLGFAVEQKKTYHVKQGLRSLGYWPRKTHWKDPYFPRQIPENLTKSCIKIPDQKKKHSDFYYRLRFIQANLRMLPGLRDFGLDFLFILRPS